MIEHTVTFALKHAPSSDEEREFLAAARGLGSIPGVYDFQIRRQTSAKNPHTHAVGMRFASASDYQAYIDHPLHVAFVNDRWLAEVSDFQESDFEELL